MTNLQARLAIIPLLVLVLVAAEARRGLIHADGELQVTVRGLDVSAFPEARFFVTVAGPNGRAVTGLDASNFRLSDGARTFSLKSVQGVIDARLSIASLLVIDTSGSMVGQPINAARDAARLYIQAKEPADEVALINFANGVQLLADFNTDAQPALLALEGFSAQGNTALFNAVSQAAQRASARPGFRRVVLLLSDGENFGAAGSTRAQALEAARASGIPFYVVGLGPSIDQQFLQELADVSGGRLFIAPNADQLGTLFTQISELLRTEYVVVADLSGSGLAGKRPLTLRAQNPLGNGQAVLEIEFPALPVATVPPASAPATAAPDDGGSSLALLLALAAVVIAGAGGWLGWRWYANRPSPALVMPTLPPVFAEAQASAGRDEAPPAALRLQDGSEILLGGGVVTLGTDPESTYRLPIAVSDFGTGEVRVWFANQRYLVHDASQRPRLRVNGRAVSWSVLADGDEIEIRGVRLRFVSRQAAVPAPF